MAHYFDRIPEVAEEKKEIRFAYGGKDFLFISSSGVFSKNHLDEGSRTLLDAAVDLLKREEEAASGNLLDLGCGYGVLGIVLKRLFPKLRLTLADINRRALDLAKENVRANRLGPVKIVESDAWAGWAEAEEDERYRYIVTNPPIRAGKQVVFAFFQGAAAHLEEGGKFLCVVAKQQGAASAHKELRRLFADVSVIWRNKGFHVFSACQPLPLPKENLLE